MSCDIDVKVNPTIVKVAVASDPVVVNLKPVDATVKVKPVDAVVNVKPVNVNVNVAAMGVPGLTGPPGATFYYLHTQAAPSAGWSVTHSLGKKPNVAVIVGSETVGVPVTHVDDNSIYIPFSSPQTGLAVCS